MNISRVAGALVALLVLGACETTGDPRRGGLLGWSEKQARVRQAEKRAAVQSADAMRAKETNRSVALERSAAAENSRITGAAGRIHESRARLAAEREAALRKAQLLEEESPTSATASRVRAYRATIEWISADEALRPAERGRRLRNVVAEIDEARSAIVR